MSTDETSVEAAVARARSLQDSVGDLTAVLLNASQREARRWRRTTAMVIVTFVLAMWGGWRLVDRIERGVACLNQEMAAHRNDNRGSHEKLGEGHGLVLPPATGLPDPQPVEAIKRLCAPFYKGGNE